jgi:putative oxidoreductase
MNQAIVLLVARVLLASLFIAFAVRGLLAFPVTAAYFASLGFPVPLAAAGLSIAMQLVAGSMLVLGWKVRHAAWALLAYVLVATAVAHRYWEFDPAYRLGQLGNFYKNLAIAGGLMLLATFGPGRLSIDRR